MDTEKLLQKLLNPIRRQIRSIMARGVVHHVNDDHLAQTSFLADEIRDEVEVLQQYGFTSRPLKDSQCIAVCSGNRDGLVIIATGDRRYRLPLKNGEVALYTDEGSYLHFKRGNVLELNAKKFIIKNGSSELIGVLSDLLQVLSQTLVSTSLGPQPFTTKAEIDLLKSKMDSFKGEN